MKLSGIKVILLLVVLVSFRSPLYAENNPLSYTPAVVTLSGTIFEASYGDDPPSPRYRGHHAWILHLKQPISIRGIPGDEFNTEATNVREIHLNVDHAKHTIPKSAFNKTGFVATGTLYQPRTAYFLRPVVMYVSTLKPAKRRGT